MEKKTGVTLLTEDELRALLGALADSFGMNEMEKSAWVDHCALAELRGNLMQSLANMDRHFVSRFRDGQVQFGATIDVVDEQPAMAILDAHGALGPYVAQFAMQFACERAQRTGLFAVAVRNANDWCMLSYATRQALSYECVGLAMTTGTLRVAPFGATSAVSG